MIIAVDGPAGSGKSSVSKEVAKRLGITFLDSGALYRACAYIKITLGVDGEELFKAVADAGMEFVPAGLMLTIGGEAKDVSKEIRTPEIAKEVSAVAQMPEIRELVTEKLREMSKKTSVIMDGRDIGTAVFPDADYKFYLNASPMERARRRMKDYDAQGIDQSIEEIAADIAERDRLDMEREHSPLKKADDAEEIDTTSLTIDEVITIIATRVQPL